MRCAAAAVFIFLVSAMPATWVSAANLSASSAARVIVPLSVSIYNILNFGVLAAGDTPGVVKASAGPPTASGGVQVVSWSQVEAKLGVQLLGEPFTAVAVFLPASVTVTSENLDTMLIDELPGGGGAGFPLTLNDGGGLLWASSPALHVAALQPVGVYTGTFEVTASYD